MSGQRDHGITCGKCGSLHDYAAVYDRFASNYSTYFDFKCGCGATIEVEVESIPEFHTVRTRDASPAAGTPS